MSPIHRRIGTTLAVVVVAAFAAPASASAVTCDRVASTGGSDTAAGTASAPYRTPQKLADSLSAGQTGCLRAGTYTQDVKVTRGGSSDTARVTLASYPGERALLVGRLWIAQGANFVTVRDLDLDGKNSSTLPSPTITANDAVFTNDDVTNEHTTICFVVGNGGYGYAARTLIQGNRIHHCGILPALNHDHGIYVSNATDTKVLDNVIYQNADRGVQMYPDAQRTIVERNVIDGNGEGVLFSGGSSTASSNNLVQNNVITNSVLRHNIESYWGGPIGTGNLATNNCVWNSAQSNIGDQVGFTAVDNLVADPQYANRGAGDFTIPASNPCAALLAGAPLSSLQTTTAPPPTTTTTTPPPAPTPSPSTGDTTGGTSGGTTKPGKRHGQTRARTALAPLSVSVRRTGNSLRVSGRVGRAYAHRSLRLRVDLRGGNGWRTVGSRTLRNQTAFQATIALARAAATRSGSGNGRLGVRVRLGSVAQRVVWLKG